MKVKLPADLQSAISEMGGVTALLDKNGWRAAAFIAVSTTPTGKGRITPERFAAKINAKGWSAQVVERHYDAWEAAADAGRVPHADTLQYGQRIELPTDGWAAFYSPAYEVDDRYTGVKDRDRIIAQAQADGTGPSKAVDIAKNTRAMAAAIIASPKVQEAAAKALVDAGAVKLLVHSMADAAQNQREQRNRRAAERGDPKPRRMGDSVEMFPPGTAAFLGVQGLSEALRALVTTFPEEWANLSDEARSDSDFRDVCLETLERINVAADACRAMVEGITANELAQLLGGN